MKGKREREKKHNIGIEENERGDDDRVGDGDVKK